MVLMDERREHILEDALKKGSVTVHDLANKYSVTYETIRKDLAQLEKQGLLIKSHGGAVLKQKTVENPFNVRQEKNIDLKQEIAEKATKLIPEGASVIIATGSTVLELAKLLILRNDLKIFTDSIPAATYLLSSENEVYLFGGKIRPKSSSVYGGWTNDLIRSVNVDLCFVGSDGFNGFNGPTSPSYSDASIDSTIFEQSRKQYILADTSKFTTTSIYQLAPWNKLTGLVTNNSIDAEMKHSLENRIEII